ncbi:NAD(P)-dependent oxidoreductase [Mechercharimyces sp. CAU 1602]|uniref:NAD-dependent epimerase/dehydratase family protein n=1 Tax=Mechercharimyces sp. CAU 1602 TaxID=2973933 RepID=UPI002162CBA0|nr:NAD(P)-dependent oxidoreductase [Mechercharimyces sp. CAU 1602]MCS1351490.1 NAD(P)-dependent oxidoreductase [Mechercharimyces sp. CAU 1602]
MRKILVTGAAGKIGRDVVSVLGRMEEYQLRLADINYPGLEPFRGTHEVIELDVADMKGCQAVCEGVDVVIHLAGDPSPDGDFYSSLLDGHIKGTYNILRSAKDNRVSRVIVASSAQTIENYPLDHQIQHQSPVRPKNMYGVSKCFVEAVASYFGYSEGLQTIALRIGAYDDLDAQEGKLSARDMSAYLSPADFADLLLKTITAEQLPPFCTLHAISDNRFKRLNLDETKKLVGYEPTADAFALSEIPLFDREETVK